MPLACGRNGNTPPRPLLVLCRYDYVCNGTINPKVCIRKGSLQVRAAGRGTSQHGKHAAGRGACMEVQAALWLPCR